MNTFHRCLVVIAISAAVPAIAVADDHQRFAEACYQQTVYAQAGKRAEELDTRSCDRALLRGPRRDSYRSDVLHNRAIIEMAQGKEKRGRASLEASVALALEVGKPHVALAVLAHRQGDYGRAYALYEQVLSEASSHPDVEPLIGKLTRNFESVARQAGVAALGR